MQDCECTKGRCVVKMVSCILCDFHINKLFQKKTNSGVVHLGSLTQEELAPRETVNLHF